MPIMFFIITWKQKKTETPLSTINKHIGTYLFHAFPIPCWVFKINILCLYISEINKNECTMSRSFLALNSWSHRIFRARKCLVSVPAGLHLHCAPRLPPQGWSRNWTWTAGGARVLQPAAAASAASSHWQVSWCTLWPLSRAESGAWNTRHGTRPSLIVTSLSSSPCSSGTGLLPQSSV